MNRKHIALSLTVVIVLTVSGCGSRSVKLNQRTESFTDTSYEQPASEEAATSQAVSEVNRGSLNYSEAPELSAKVGDGSLPAVDSRLPIKEDVFIAQTDATGNALEIGEYCGNCNMQGLSGSWGIARPVLESIIRYNCDGSYVPNVIKSYEANEDYTEWTFKLRQGMKWSDGDDFNADDITFWYYMVHINNYDTKASWEALKDNETGEFAVLKKVDDYTVTWKFDTPKYPGAFIENGDLKWCWAPSHYLIDLIPASLYVENEYWENTGLSDGQVLANAAAKGMAFESVADLGKNACYYFWNVSGIPTVNSFVLSTEEGHNSKSSEICILERNPYYWKVDAEGKQLPYFDNIYMFNELEDKTAAFANGELDYMDVGMEQIGSMLSELGDAAVLKTVLGSSWGADQLTFNYTCKDKNYADLFANPDFRQAVSMCVDRQEISLRISEGFMRPGQCAPSTGSMGYDEEWSKKWTDYDFASAQKLLEGCGLKLGGDGYYHFADGSDLSIDFVSLEGNADTIYSALKRYFESAHLKTTLTDYDAETYDQLIDDNDWIASMCPHMDAGGLSLSERAAAFVPIAQAAEWYGEYGTYYTDHSLGVAPSGDMEKLVEYYEQWINTADSAKRDEIASSIYELHKNNLWSIAYVEGANSYCLINPKFHNFANKLISNDLYQYMNIYHFETLFKK